MLYRQTGNTAIKTAAAIVGMMGTGQLLATQRPNIILIMTDQQTYEAMSNRGNPDLLTPAMDALAADGITFTRSYCSYPLSGPSRASLMTGRMPCELGITDNEEPLPEKEIKNTLGLKLSEAGYDCLYAGKWHIPSVEIPETGFGFKKISGMNDVTLVRNVQPELEKKHEKPIFLVASFLNPHDICEYARSQTLHYGEINIPENAHLPALPKNFNIEKGQSEGLLLHKQMVPKSYPTQSYTKNDWQKYLFTYYRLVEKVDKSVGELVALLKKNGLYENSLIIFTSDHGDGVAAHHWNQKRALFEEIIHIPLIIKAPKNDYKTYLKNSDALVNIGLDIYPTICEYADVEIPVNRRGKSLQKNLRGDDSVLHENIFVETFLDGVDLRGWCVIDGEYKYVLYQYFKNKEQLFNLKTDIGETRNLANNLKYADIRSKMREKMLKHAQEINDLKLLKELK